MAAKKKTKAKKKARKQTAPSTPADAIRKNLVSLARVIDKIADRENIKGDEIAKVIESSVSGIERLTDCLLKLEGGGHASAQPSSSQKQSAKKNGTSKMTPADMFGKTRRSIS